MIYIALLFILASVLNWDIFFKAPKINLKTADH
jgi:hypothetical protein